jgi:hypothetical protein
MTDADLDRSYTALCNALADVGEPRSALLLSMVCLALLARRDSADEVLPLIARARERCLQEPGHGQ